MTREGTKKAAEAVLCELPSVIGAFVREDVHGHPREIHLLVRSGPNPRHLAYDVRDLLEERLGIPVDQRVISIAQLAPGKEPGPILARRSAAAGAGAASGPESPAPETQLEPEPEPEETDARVRFTGISAESADKRVRVQVTLELDDVEVTGEESGLDTAPARMRTAVAATLQAVDTTCVGRARFEVEHVSLVRAFERDYVLVTVMVSSPFLGRKPIPLVGAQPVEVDTESAAALAALKAVNRTLSLVLRLSDERRKISPRRANR
ncbi:MAG TPA: hypothetical protein VHG09_06525 [Longimicrobiales bacterium]|nr:hypothetical protein [Longimicrobiales bacterium]